MTHRVASLSSALRNPAASVDSTITSHTTKYIFDSTCIFKLRILYASLDALHVRLDMQILAPEVSLTSCRGATLPSYVRLDGLINSRPNITLCTTKYQLVSKQWTNGAANMGQVNPGSSAGFPSYYASREPQSKWKTFKNTASRPGLFGFEFVSHEQRRYAAVTNR
jgi:hypothetical protein